MPGYEIQMVDSGSHVLLEVEHIEAEDEVSAGLAARTLAESLDMLVLRVLPLAEEVAATQEP